jgi:hypothetical protein
MRAEAPVALDILLVGLSNNNIATALPKA